MRHPMASEPCIKDLSRVPLLKAAVQSLAEELWVSRVKVPRGASNLGSELEITQVHILSVAVTLFISTVNLLTLYFTDRPNMDR
ncbi:hypothetical protein J6590_017495 [Homalodisca vitripennis]|nr:hypothetical protein J6590_017495 [Homalodisca vitripennis]